MVNLFEGVRILDLTRLLPGPFATMIFADAGADVIKIEDRRGGDYARYYPPLVDDMSTFFASVNRNKRSIALDLKVDDDRGVFDALVRESDVVIESFRPGVMAKLGYDFDALRTLRDDVILCSISGYGQTGPFASRAGHDLNYLAKSGLLSVAGRPGARPTPPPFQLADLAGGALYAVAGIAGALFRRERTGEGALLDISMAEGALSFAIPLVAQHREKEVKRGGEMLNGGVPCYDVYETRDGRFLTVAGLEPKFWSVFVDAIGKPEWLNDGYDPSIADDLAKLIASRDLSEWVTLFEARDACVEPVIEIDELHSDPVHVAREVFFELGGVNHLWTPLSSKTVASAAPTLDQHGDEIRAWLQSVGQE